MSRFVFFIFLFLLGKSGFSLDHKHEKWDRLLKTYVTKSGFVDYKKLQKDAKTPQHTFLPYLKELEGVTQKEYEAFSRHEKMAFLINAYNAFTLKLIIDHYPVKSIRKIGGFFTKPWDMEFFSLLGGTITSLDPIEHEVLRPQFKDYRIHAAVNCASISCPLLRAEAYVASRLNEQLEEQMRIWLADSSKNAFDPKTGRVSLSKIFDWYEEDFVKYGGGVVGVLKKYGPASSKEALKKHKSIEYLDYDWGLNGA